MHSFTSWHKTTAQKESDFLLSSELLFFHSLLSQLSLILVHLPTAPKIKALAIPRRVLHWVTSWLLSLLLTAPFCSPTQIQVLKVHYCNTVPLKMQNALNTIKLQKISHQCIQLKKNKKEKKQKVIKLARSPSVLHVSDTSDPAPILVPSP